MSSQVLYRKWRPQRLAEVVGQGPITQTLRQAVIEGRVAHAYLFCGPRGTGKTSTARILAKAANCQSPQDGEPDNACRLCQSVDTGQAMDLIEMDAASNRGIEDIRNMRDRVSRMPAEARYKVYIIDEAHMLTGEAFNAFLKTLEEPPPHVIFILCTTEPHKVPPTIISRCQRFDFRRIPQEAVVGRLEVVAQGEGLQVEPQALRAIARAASGSLRDACNILEQLATSYGPTLGLEQVRELLGEEASQEVLEFVRHLLAGQVPQGLQVLSRVAASGADLRAFHRLAVEHLRAVLLLKSGVTEVVELPPEVLKELRPLLAGTPWERLLRAVKLFGGINFRVDTPTSLPLELALVETSLGEGPRVEVPAAGARGVGAEHPVRGPGALRPVSPPSPAPPPAHRGPEGEALRQEVPGPSASGPGAAGSSAGPGKAAVPDAQWDALFRLLKRVKGKKYVLGSLLLDCQGHHLEGGVLCLSFKSQANRDRFQEELEHPPARKALQEAITSALGADYELRLEVVPGNGPGNRSSGHLVRAAISLGARIVDEGGGKE